MLKYIKMLRIKHWIKNGIVFLPLFFGGKLFSDSFFKCCLGFLGFSLISSCVYIINDIFDVDKDRLHSEKCKRPIASGEISIKKASVIAVVCGIAGMLCVVFNWKAVLILAVYLILNILYSSGLKNIPIADVLILASGFVFRLILGSFITQIEVSSWLCLTVIAASFYLGLGKRRGEIMTEGTEKRKVLEFYTYNFLDKSMYMCLTLALVFYSLWSISTNKYLVWTVIMVLVIMLKYNLNVENKSSGDPVEVFLSDKILLVLAIIYIIIMALFVYIFN